MCLGDFSYNMYFHELLDGKLPLPRLLFASSMSLTLDQFGNLSKYPASPRETQASRMCFKYMPAITGIYVGYIRVADALYFLIGNRYRPGEVEGEMDAEMAISIWNRTKMSLQALLHDTSRCLLFVEKALLTFIVDRYSIHSVCAARFHRRILACWLD